MLHLRKGSKKLRLICSRIYSLTTGKCLGVVSSPDESHIKGTCFTLLGGHLSAFYTTSDMFLIQVSQILSIGLQVGIVSFRFVSFLLNVPVNNFFTHVGTEPPLSGY